MADERGEILLCEISRSLRDVRFVPFPYRFLWTVFNSFECKIASVIMRVNGIFAFRIMR